MKHFCFVADVDKNGQPLRPFAIYLSVPIFTIANFIGVQFQLLFLTHCSLVTQTSKFAKSNSLNFCSSPSLHVLLVKYYISLLFTACWCVLGFSKVLLPCTVYQHAGRSRIESTRDMSNVTFLTFIQ